MNKGENIQIPFRKWDLYESPTLRQTSSDVWALRTSTSLEKPRYLIIGFQNNDQSNSIEKDANVFITADISDIRLYLNSTVSPYERWNLDFKKKLCGPAYFTYENFHGSYYGQEVGAGPLCDYAEFIIHPIFIIDCSHQPEDVKSSTVDVKLEFQTRESKFPAGTTTG